MKTFVGICNSQEYVHSTFFWSFINMLKTECSIVPYQSGHPWDVVRNNQMIKKFLDSDCDCFVKMDVDQVYPADYFKVMLPLVEKYKVIGPLIFDRHEQNGFIPLAFENGEYGKLKPFNFTGHTTGIVNIPYTHTNLFYHRDVLFNVDMPWYEAKLSADGLDRANHVDYQFLDKIKEVGFPIYTNMDVVVKHIAFVGIDVKFFNVWQAGVKSYGVSKERSR